YLRFDVTPPAGGQMSRAVLWVYSTGFSLSGYQVRPLADPAAAWGERTITYSTAPALGLVAGSAGQLRPGAWSSVDVTTLVRDALSVGTRVSFALTTDAGKKGPSLASRETGANAPQLVVEVSASTPTTTATATSTPSPTVTTTATFTPVAPLGAAIVA